LSKKKEKEVNIVKTRRKQRFGIMPLETLSFTKAK